MLGPHHLQLSLCCRQAGVQLRYVQFELGADSRAGGKWPRLERGRATRVARHEFWIALPPFAQPSAAARASQAGANNRCNRLLYTPRAHVIGNVLLERLGHLLRHLLPRAGPQRTLALRQPLRQRAQPRLQPLQRLVAPAALLRGRRAKRLLNA